MNKLLVIIFFSLFPALVLAADGALSFAPPASDYSVVFLGNLFGIVDGVLSGSGSQIMGAMFSVFNSAVLALGGMIIMYTLIVSTMNTAHEGQMLGQKWSSIWIPVRSTLGLALLIPKASGYCLMQIFVMWVVVQGIGAADKVWDAALGYLNRGGVIIQAQPSSGPLDALGLTKTGVPQGAMAIFSGEVCMLALQKQIEAQKQKYLDMKQKGAGPCNSNNSSKSSLDTFCNSAIPDFLGTVNAVTLQSDAMSHPNARGDKQSAYSVDMPNFIQTSPFYALNGICGTIKWNAIADLSKYSGQTGSNTTVGGGTVPVDIAGMKIVLPAGSVTLSASELETAQLARAIGIQQMYNDLSTVARIMINNDPAIGSQQKHGAGASGYSLNAKQQFGVPYTQAGTICNDYANTCVIWGPLPTTGTNTGSGVLFNGTEFQNAINDYNGIMSPTINLINQTKKVANGDTSRAFINKAKTEGWIMAGSYFFDLVRLNGKASDTSTQTDTNTGLEESTSTFDGLGGASSGTGNSNCNDKYKDSLCKWFGLDTDKLVQVQALIDGTYATAVNGVPSRGDPIPKPSLTDKMELTKFSSVKDVRSASVYGFINNSMMVQLPGQPGLKPLTFANLFHFKLEPISNLIPSMQFPCGTFIFGYCLGRMFGDFFYNIMLRSIMNTFYYVFTGLVNQVLTLMLTIPLAGMMSIFQDGLHILNDKNINPIVALANMGVTYINFSSNFWLTLLPLMVFAGAIPIFGIFVIFIMGLIMPLLLAWLGIMVSIGFITAYYVPILPYMIFTFGSMAWLISVIEAMVAAPIVALGVTHPEGHDAFGKGEHAIMILMNVFLRPALMIIGYITGIALCYVSVWVLNAGFDHAIGFIQQSPSAECLKSEFSCNDKAGGLTGDYSDWAGLYANFFSILIYTSMYLTIVQKAFTLIGVLPDKVLRWIGGSPESVGEQSAQWGEEMKSKIGEGAKSTQDAQQKMGEKLGAATKSVLPGMPKGSGSVKGSGDSGSTPPGEG